MFLGNIKETSVMKWVNLLSANPKNGQTYSTIRGLLPTNCLSVFDHFVGLELKELTIDAECEGVLITQSNI